ncbi:hypothetical protein P3X46_017443 [Hevea brasiliensis]|uniref:KANL2-like probable zinc-finger domain-containing protein n=1 Tax=Hevea brasiliensis TaxID=3981 RepID=A0ABQ9LMM7_HEVBR|nr:uncharacterized protein LOC110632838 isoform X1 [Hevea brasiliensis]KAJ9169231.1 hypothetical protein P3X46_017443 [Hevea brasiliensis]
MDNAPLPSEAMSIDGSALDSFLSSSAHLTHHEVITRRSRRVKQLAKIYRTHYWALMEDLKAKYKEYYWKYGKSPFKGDEKKRKTDGIKENSANGIPELNGKLGFKEDEDVEEEEGIRKCAVGGCKATPMALTRFCHPHILLDSKQKLYIGCTFVVKSAQGRPVHCGKPILRSAVPALCPPHFQKAETYVARALRKAGLNVSSPSKIAPKFHVIVREFVHQIQTKRRAAQKEEFPKLQIKEDKTL